MKTSQLPEKHEPFTDKYFLRSKEILQKDNINPIVRYRVFARKAGNFDRDESIEIIEKYSGLSNKQGHVYALPNGRNKPLDTLMLIEGRVQDLIELETMYLGVISAELTNKEIDMKKVKKNAERIVEEANVPVIYFGARHFHYSLDPEISRICLEDGMKDSSTDIGAANIGKKGAGTIPHALVLTYGSTVKAAKAFDKYIPKEIPRVVLIDTYNKEIDDSVATAKALGNLAAVRVDTCGENYSQDYDSVDLTELKGLEKYVDGKGVTIKGVWALRRALDKYPDVGIFVSSGFNAEKTKAFTEASKIYEQKYGKKLFTGIGTGSVEDVVMATSDIVARFDEKKQLWVPCSKVGREYNTYKKDTRNLEKVF